MSRRTLLIDSASLDELKLDGPALCLRSKGRSRQWFPLRRLSRILCVEMPSQGMDALLHTANRGVPVSIFTRRGKLIAQLIHPGALPGPLLHWLDALPGDPELQGAYDQWLENQLRHTYGLLGCIARTPQVAARRAEEQLTRLVRKNRCSSLVEAARHWVEGLLVTRVQSQCMMLGLPANSSHLSMLYDHLREAGVTLSLTALVLHAREHGPIDTSRLAVTVEARLGAYLEHWVARALYTLAQQLEWHAMAQDTPRSGGQ